MVLKACQSINLDDITNVESDRLSELLLSTQICTCNLPQVKGITYQKFPIFLKKLVDEHNVLRSELSKFEEILKSIQEEGMTFEAHRALVEFYELLDRKILNHNTKEEKILFPVLQKKLISQVAGSNEGFPITALDLMEEEHTKMNGQAAVSFNLFELASKLREDKSILLTLGTAIEKAKELVRSMRLHIFREDNIIFALASKHLSKAEFKLMEEQLSVFDQYGQDK